MPGLKTRPPWERPTRPRTPPAMVTHISLVLTWFEELKAKVPASGQAKQTKAEDPASMD